MRVCLVSREMAPFWGAGIGTYVASMARAWSSAGHEVHVLGVNDAEALTKGPRLFPGVRFHGVDPLAEPDERTLWRSDVARRSQQVRRALARLHAVHRFDYIEFPEYFAEGALSIRGARLLGELEGATLGVRLHTPDRLCRDLNADPVLGFNRLLTDQLERESITEADAVISPTRALLHLCREDSPPADDRAEAVVPYPFDAPEFLRSCGLAHIPFDARPPAVASETLGVVPEILYFGRLERRKGVDLLIDAFGLLISRGVACTLRLVGADTRTGPGGTSMREHLVMRLGSTAREHVAFEEPRSRSELGPVVRASMRSGGVCCFPSRWENFPNALLEAMALGATVICSHLGGMSEIVEDERSGLLFEPGNPDRLARTIERALRDRPLRERLGREAPARVDALCSPQNVVDATVRAITSIPPTGRVHAHDSAPRPTPTRIVAEIQIDKPGAAREIDEARARAGRDQGACALVRASNAQVDPRLIETALHALSLAPEVHMVTSHILGPDPAHSWIPMGLHPDALCALDLSGIGSGAVIRLADTNTDSLESACSALGIGTEGLPWILAALLCDHGISSFVIPEPWIRDDRPRDPYALQGPGMHRARIAAADIAGRFASEAPRLLASVLGR